MPGSRGRKWCLALIAIAGLNFLAFFIGSAVLGGDAINGKTEDGRYYVADHGKLTEVSAAAFTYSRLHCYSVWVLHPVALVSLLLLYRRK